MNGKWQFEPASTPAGCKRGVTPPPELPAPTADGWDPTPIRIPSPWNSNRWGNGRTGEGTDRPYVADSVCFPSYPAAWDGVRMGWLRRTFTVPAGWTQGRIVLHFEAVSGAAQIVVNGRPVGEHFDKFLPFDMDITDAVKRQGENELLVGVRDSEFFDKFTPGHQPGLVVTYPAGSAIERLIGIWNDVFLWNLPGGRVDDVFVQLKSADGQPLRDFELAGANGKYVPATAEIRGGVVVVIAPGVPAAATVRYAFQPAPERPNFTNSDGLPATAFRTDTQPLPGK